MFKKGDIVTCVDPCRGLEKGKRYTVVGIVCPSNPRLYLREVNQHRMEFRASRFRHPYNNAVGKELQKHVEL